MFIKPTEPPDAMSHHEYNFINARIAFLNGRVMPVFFH
ncbi:hypothetical protein C4J98_4578 [Pseudomonas orientalis]|nr:hypothetical protein C4J98_4578 [Pseudomonas orientalis]